MSFASTFFIAFLALTAADRYKISKLESQISVIQQENVKLEHNIKDKRDKLENLKHVIVENNETIKEHAEIVNENNEILYRKLKDNNENREYFANKNPVGPRIVDDINNDFRNKLEAVSLK